MVWDERKPPPIKVSLYWKGGRRMSKEEYKEQFKQMLLYNTVTDASITLEKILSSLEQDIQNSEKQTKEAAIVQLHKAYQEVLYELVGESKTEEAEIKL